MSTYSIARFRRGFVSFLGGRALQALARAALLLILVRLLPVEEYGAYMLLIGLSEMMLEVASFGLMPVIQRFTPELITHSSFSRMFGFVGSIAVAQFIGMSLIVWLLHRYWQPVSAVFGFDAAMSQASILAVWLFLIVPAFRLAADVLEALLEQGRAQICRALLPTLRIIGISVLLLLDQSISLATILALDIVVISSVLILVWVLTLRALSTHAGAAPGSAQPPMPIADMATFAWHMAPVGLLGAAQAPGALRLIVANALGLQAAGLFAFLQSLERLVSRYLPGVLLRGLIRPILVSRYVGSGGLAFVSNGFNLLSKSNLLIVAGAVVAVAAMGDQLVAILSGGKFLDAGTVLLAMMVTMLFTSQRAVVEMTVQIVKETGILRLTMFIAPLTLLAAWYWSGLGLIFVVAMVGLGAALANGIALLRLRRISRSFEVDWSGYARIFALTVVLAAAAYLLPVFGNPIATAAPYVLLYALLLILVKPYRAGEVGLIEKAAGRRAAAVFGPWSKQGAH